MADNFFAMLVSGEIRRIALTQAIEAGVRQIFLDGGQRLIGDKDEVEFDGNYKVDEDEILFVNMTMEGFDDVVDNPINIPILDLQDEEVRVLFWHEEGVFYFQNFDKRKLLRNKMVLIFSQQTYGRLQENAFVLDNVVSAVHSADKFYFQSYATANKIFDLSDYYSEATNEALEEFGNHAKIAVEDLPWLLENANSIIRKWVALVQNSGYLDAADTRKIRREAGSYNVTITLDSSGKIIFPKDQKTCKEILSYLNEQFFTGSISGAHYRANSKRSV
jgi:hypothetical protein